MKIVIRVELIAEWGESATAEVCEFNRPASQVGPETIGLSLEDGKQLLQAIQQQVVVAQAWEVGEPYLRGPWSPHGVGGATPKLPQSKKKKVPATGERQLSCPAH